MIEYLEWYKKLLSHQYWILGRDFNLITTLKEKKGGRRNLMPKDTLFKEFIDDNNLLDLETPNGIFTWNNKRGGSNQITSWLDRFIVYDNIETSIGDFMATILPSSGSDHWPISLLWQSTRGPTYRPFRFEKFLLSHPDFVETVKNWWSSMQITCSPKMYIKKKKLST
jgi:hypothetical protein